MSAKELEGLIRQMLSIREKKLLAAIPLTGRLRISVPPPYIRSSTEWSASLSLEVHEIEDWIAWGENEFLREVIDGCPDKLKTKFCISGFRGVGHSPWFPHPDYHLVAPIPNKFVRGRFHSDPDSVSAKKYKWEWPKLNDDGAREFERLGLEDYRLANTVNRDRGPGPNNPFFLSYAMFRNEEQWMTAKLRFTSRG